MTGEDLCVPNALRAACMATEFCNPCKGVDETGTGSAGGGGVDREEGKEAAELGGCGGAEGRDGLIDDGSGGGAAGGWNAEDSFLEVTGGGGGLFTGTVTEDDGLGAGFGGGLLRFATNGFDKLGDDSLVCGLGRRPFSFGSNGAEPPGRVGAVGAEPSGGLGAEE